MDTYQAIYDAVRSKLSNGDIGSAIETAIRDAQLSHYAEMAAETIRYVASSYERPSVLFRPRIFIDGNQWCALYGEDLQQGTAGFGHSPEEAMQDFDKAWGLKLETRKESRMSSAWDYCPECGHLESTETGYDNGRFCDSCGQEWFPDVNYSKVVIAKLGELTAERAALERERLVSDKLEKALKLAKAYIIDDVGAELVLIAVAEVAAIRKEK